MLGARRLASYGAILSRSFIMATRSSSRNRVAFRPTVEAAERRDLLGIVGVQPLPNFLPGLQQLQVQITPGTKVKVQEVNWGDGTKDGKNARYIIKHTGKHFLIITLPPHEYTSFDTGNPGGPTEGPLSGEFQITVTMNNRPYSFFHEPNPNIF
jgi:hypothetical protein